MKLDFNKLKYSFFKYFWIILLTPKPLQLVVILGILLLILFKKTKVKMDIIPASLLLYSLVHLLSIFYRMMVTQSFDRSGAALNTALITFLAAIYYLVFKEGELNYKLAEKYMFRNMMIMYGLFLMFILRYYFSISVPNNFFGRFLYRSDWINGVTTIRFRALLEFDTLIPMFMLIAGPWALNYVYRTRSKFLVQLFLFTYFIPVYFSNSRMGMILFLIIIPMTSFILIESKRKRFYLILIFIVGGIVFLTAEYSTLVNFLEQIFYSRSGSNSARFRIYTTSINMTLENSPLIGLGIKYMLGNYPLGSHSSYIGFFYKAGLIGTSIISVFIFSSLKTTIQMLLKDNIMNKIQAIFIIGVFISMITLDIDGANWLIISFLINLSCLVKQRSVKSKAVSENVIGKDKLELNFG